MIEVDQGIYQIYTLPMRNESAIALRGGVLSKEPAGSELAEFLYVEAALDAVSLKESVEAAAISDLYAYFQAQNLNLEVKELRSILGAAMPGGNFTYKNLPLRLTKIIPSNFNLTINQICVDLQILLRDRKADLNYVRYSLNAVTKVIGDLIDIFEKKEIVGLSKAELEKLVSKVSFFMNIKVEIPNKLQFWVDELCNIYLDSSELVQQATDKVKQYPKNNKVLSKESLYSKADLTSVSTKSISTYVLRIREYALYKIQTKSVKPYAELQQLEFEKRVSKYVNYKSLSEKELMKNLLEAPDRELISTKFAEVDTQRHDVEEKKRFKITERLPSKNLAIVCYSGAKAAEDLIMPIMRSLKSQLKLMPNQTMFFSEAETNSDYLSVSVENLKEKDIEPLRHILKSHTM